jgi:CRP-like cAMP-binding protein
METLEPILAQHPFLKGLPEHHLELLVGCASNVRFEPGKFIFRDGGPADHFYIIRQGKVAVEIHSPGRGPITIETLEDGDVLGWSWLIPPYEWHFDSRAITLTRAIALDGKCLRTKFDQDHHLGYEMMKRFADIMVQRVEATTLQLLNVYDVKA